MWNCGWLVGQRGLREESIEDMRAEIWRMGVFGVDGWRLAMWYGDDDLRVVVQMGGGCGWRVRTIGGG